MMIIYSGVTLISNYSISIIHSRTKKMKLNFENLKYKLVPEGLINYLLFQTNTHFMRKIPQGAEASNILVGEVDFLEKPLSAFVRLTQATFMGDLTEVPVPTRFIFVLLGPVVSYIINKNKNLVQC